MQFHAIKAGQRAPADRLRDRRHPRERGPVRRPRGGSTARAAGPSRRVLKRGDFSGKATETFPIVGIRRGPAERILLVGLGPKSSFGRKPYRRAVFAATQWLAKGGADNATSWLAGDGVPGLDAVLRRAPRGGERQQRPVSHPGPQDRRRSPRGRSSRASASSCRTRTSPPRSAASGTASALRPASPA